MHYPAHRIFHFILLACFGMMTGCSQKSNEDNSTTTETTQRPSFEEALQKVKSTLPASGYIHNSLLPPTNDFKLSSWKDTKTRVKVGLNWIKNDEVTPLYVGIERGYFSQVGIDLEVIPGGPGRNPLPMLLSGQFDIYLEAAGSQIIWAITSKTAVPLKAIGAILQEHPYSLITLDSSVPQDTRSPKQLTREDFLGKRIGFAPATPNYLREFAWEKLNLSKNDITIVAAGATLEPLVAGAYDFYGSWMDNDPRMLDHLGYKNWVYWSFPKNGWLDVATVVTVLPETLEAKPDLLKRFLQALTLATIDMVENPEEAADAALKHIEGTQLTHELILKRIAYQSKTIRPKTDNKPVLFIEHDSMDEVAARMYQYGAIELK